jgi:hypothetical protein
MPIGNEWVITKETLNILPLGSYDVLIDMDWLTTHKVKLDCYNKTFDCVDDDGNLRIVRGILKPISVDKFQPYN